MFVTREALPASREYHREEIRRTLQRAVIDCEMLEGETS